MRGISFIAIVVGGVVDVVLSGLLGIPLGFYVVSSRKLAHLPKEQLQSAFLSAMHDDPKLRLTQLGLGFACSVLGGFVAASIAKERRLLNGALASWLCVGLGIYSAARGASAENPAIQMAMILATPLCYILGAWLKMRAVATRTLGT